MKERFSNFLEALRELFVALLVTLGIVEKDLSLEEKVEKKLQKLKDARSEYLNMKAHFTRKIHGIDSDIESKEKYINSLEEDLENGDNDERVQKRRREKLDDEREDKEKLERRRDLVQEQLDNVSDKIDQVEDQIDEMELKLEELQLKKKNLDLEKQSDEFSSDFSEEELEHEIEKTDVLIDTYEEMNMDEGEKLDQEIEEALDDTKTKQKA